MKLCAGLQKIEAVLDCDVEGLKHTHFLWGYLGFLDNSTFFLDILLRHKTKQKWNTTINIL